MTLLAMCGRIARLQDPASLRRRCCADASRRGVRVDAIGRTVQTPGRDGVPVVASPRHSCLALQPAREGEPHVQDPA